MTFTCISRAISVMLLFFGWFFILPSNYCSYASVLAEHYRVASDTFFLASNIVGILGLLSAGVLATRLKRVDRLLLAVCSLLLVSNLLLFVVPPKAAFSLMIVVYFLLGQYVAVSTFQFLTMFAAKTRFLLLGFTLVLITLYSLFFKPSSSGVTARTIYQMDLVMNLVAFSLVVVLNLKQVPRVERMQINENRPLFYAAFIKMTVYTLVLAVTLGFISHERNVPVSVSAITTNLARVVPYILTLIFMLILSNRQHFGTVTYIANTLLIISIAYADVGGNLPSLSVLITILLNCAIAVNQFFIFDTFFEMSDQSNTPAIHISIGLCAFIFGIAFGDRFADFFHHYGNEAVDRFLIVLIAVATSILPALRIQLSKLSATSIFRINPVLISLPPELPAAEVTPETTARKGAPAVYVPFEYAGLLTNREKEVLELLLKGYPSEMIASTLFISGNTLKRHVQNIYNKLNVHNRAELFRLMQSKQD